MSIGYPDWGGLQAVNVPVNIFSGIGQSVAPVNSHTLGPFNVAGQSYSIKFDPYESVAGTTPFPEIEVIISDNAGFVMDDVLYEMGMDTVLFDNQYLLKGPLNGSTLQVNVENNDNVTLLYNISIDTNSAPLLEHTCTTQQFSGMSAGWTPPPNCAPRKGILALNYRAALAAGGSDIYVLPPSPGPVTIGLQAVTPANVIHVLMAPLVNQNSYGGIAGGLMARQFTDANGDMLFTINMPRATVEIDINNGGAGATDYRWSAWYDVTSG